MPEYANYQSRVRKWSTIQVARTVATASPPASSGRRCRSDCTLDWVEVYYKGHLVERMERVRGEGEANVNYPPRHRLPGAQTWEPSPAGPTSASNCFPPCTPAGLRRARGVAR